MEEQEKKTRKSNSSKPSTSKGETTKKTTRKTNTTTTEKDSKPKKVNSTSKTNKIDTKKKQENAPKVIIDKKENVTPKIEKKPRTTATTKKSTSNKTSDVKTSKIEKAKKETIAPKSKTTEVKQKEETKNREKTLKSTNKNTKKLENKPETKRVTEKTKNKEEQPKEPKQEEKTKKYIEISIGGVIAVIFIGVLIFLNISLGKWAYNVTKEKNTVQNSTVDTSATTEETIGIVLNSQNQIVSKLLDKITLPLGTTANIYQIGNFDENTMPDDLKLRIGWAKLKEENKFHAKQATGESIIVVEKSAMEQSVKEVLGTQVKYKDMSFDNSNTKEFAEYSETRGIITYDGENYTGIVNDTTGEGNLAFAYQEIQKVVQYDNEIAIVVKTAFVRQENNQYIIYKDFNENFENRLMEIASDELFKNASFNKITGEGSIAVSKNAALNNIRNELNTYKYTFLKDDSTGEYYLKEFRKENKNV